MGVESIKSYLDFFLVEVLETDGKASSCILPAANLTDAVASVLLLMFERLTGIIRAESCGFTKSENHSLLCEAAEYLDRNPPETDGNTVRALLWDNGMEFRSEALYYGLYRTGTGEPLYIKYREKH